MVKQLLQLALVGGEPILYVLLFLSLLSIAVVLERAIFYARISTDVPALTTRLVNFLNQGDVKKALDEIQAPRSAEIAVIREGLLNYEKGPTVVSELMESMAMKQQQGLDRWLPILGTIGSTAPFIGLLGTVLGIVKAFHDLAFDTQGGPSVVMAGIAEALVATAVGLVVAIPAVICFNYFKNRQKRTMSNIAQIERTLLAFLKERNVG